MDKPGTFRNPQRFYSWRYGFGNASVENTVAQSSWTIHLRSQAENGRAERDSAPVAGSNTDLGGPSESPASGPALPLSANLTSWRVVDFDPDLQTLVARFFGQHHEASVYFGYVGKHQPILRVSSLSVQR